MEVMSENHGKSYFDSQYPQYMWMNVENKIKLIKKS